MGETAELVLGVDAGTTSVKAVVVDRDGAVVGSAASDPIPTHEPERGASIQRTGDIWAAFVSACRGGLDLVGSGAVISGLCVAAQSGSVVPVTGGAGPTALTWMDSRSRRLVDTWDAATRRTIRATSGWSAGPGLGLATIAWHRTQDSGIPVERWASIDDFLVHELTGSWTTNPSNAAGMQLMEIASREWSPALCGIAGIATDDLSTIAPCGSFGPGLTDGAARTTGLPEAVRLVIGGHDQSCAALGLGVTAPGSALLSTGTAWVLTLVTDDEPEVGDLPDGFNLSPHVVPGRWTVSCNLGGLGATLADGLERGDAGHVRSLMETAAAETTRAIGAISAIAPVRDLTVVGGGTRSDDLTRLIAEVTGLPVLVRPDASWPAVGAAALAASALGWGATIEGREADDRRSTGADQ